MVNCISLQHIMVLTQIVCLGAYVTFLPCPLTILTSVWLKASSDLEKKIFQSKLCPRSIWYGVWFSDQKLRRAKKRKVKVSQFAIAINTLTRPQPTHYTFSFFTRPFITRVPGVYLWLSLLLSFFIQKPNLRFDLLTRFGFHLHLLVDICHPFSVFLSVSGTLFRPLQYLKVVVFLPSDLFFTLSTKQISFL